MPHGSGSCKPIIFMNSYSFFLFIKLHDEIRGTKNSEQPYDYMYEGIQAEYQRYLNSEWYSKGSDYESIVNFLSDMYLGTAGITGHDSKSAFKYNRLLDTLGAGGMLMQFERYIDSEDLTDFIQHVEDNLAENDIELPY